MAIAILCPTRGRPYQFSRMVGSVLNTKSYENDVFIYSFHSDNAEAYELSGVNSTIQGPEWPTAHKWNYLAQRAMNERPDCKLFMLGADDMYFDTPEWDKALIDHYNSLENKIHVYALQDSRDENGTPHVICTREYIEAMGYFMPPIFLHWYIDSWTTAIAKSNKCFTHLRDYKLIHDKPSDHGKADETHSRIRQWGWRERDQYVAETCKHFLELEKQRLAEKIRPYANGEHADSFMGLYAIGKQ